MRKANRTVALAMAACACVSIGFPAAAQETVKELRAMDGKQLSADEVRNVLVGKTFIRKNERGNEISVDIVPDGSVKGYVSTPRGSAGISGKWGIAEDGRMCVDYTFTDKNIPASNWCGYHFTAQNRYFLTDTVVAEDTRLREWRLKP